MNPNFDYPHCIRTLFSKYVDWYIWLLFDRSLGLKIGHQDLRQAIIPQLFEDILMKFFQIGEFVDVDTLASEVSRSKSYTIFLKKPLTRLNKDFFNVLVTVKNNKVYSSHIRNKVIYYWVIFNLMFKLIIKNYQNLFVCIFQIFIIRILRSYLSESAR